MPVSFASSTARLDGAPTAQTIFIPAIAAFVSVQNWPGRLIIRYVYQAVYRHSLMKPQSVYPVHYAHIFTGSVKVFRLSQTGLKHADRRYV